MLAWLRVGFGALAGVIAGIAGFVTPVSVAAGLATANQNAYYGFYVAIIVFLGSYYLAKYRILKGIAPKDKNRLITQGIGSFIIMFIFTWILINTLHYCIALFRLSRLVDSCFVNFKEDKRPRKLGLDHFRKPLPVLPEKPQCVQSHTRREFPRAFSFSLNPL